MRPKSRTDLIRGQVIAEGVRQLGRHVDRLWDSECPAIATVLLHTGGGGTAAARGAGAGGGAGSGAGADAGAGAGADSLVVLARRQALELMLAWYSEDGVKLPLGAIAQVGAELGSGSYKSRGALPLGC